MDKNKIAVDLFNKQAEVYQSKFMDVALYADTLDYFCDRLPQTGAAVFEIACGPGNVTRYLLNRRPDLKISGTDLAPNMIALAQNNNPQVTFHIMDGRQIGSLPGKYDGLMCGFFLPYLSKAEAIQLIQDAYAILNHGGVFYLSTMEDLYEHSAFKRASSGDEIFMHFHEACYLSEALQQSGFTVLKTERKIYPAPDGTVTTDLIIIAQK